MTRFARARGSKSSNEKAPEDGTPWEVMKEQLLKAKKENEDAKNREKAEQQRIENYENFLKEQKTQKRKATWCDFPDAKQDTAANGLAKKKKKNKKTAQQPVVNDVVSENTVVESKKVEKNNQTQGNDVHSSKVTHNDGNESKNGDVREGKNKKKRKKNKNKQTNGTVPSSDGAQTENTNAKEDTNEKKQSDTQTQQKQGENGQQKKKNKKNKKKVPKESNPSETHNTDNQTNNTNSKPVNDNQVRQKPKKNKKLVDGKPVRRKEINDRSFQLIVNGKDIELVRFDGFPIMKKDAERIAELKSNMIKKGIPKSEVARTIKLERRRAEKALARVKKDVCYNCRKGGHMLSDCPDLKSKMPNMESADGVCFKCGSTEHRQSECKVQRDKEYRFATCFICKEAGHIARQCPDNPKGLYPNGGSCKLCGDVTHLRKDCPTIQDTKESTSVKLQTLDSSDNIEGIGSRAALPAPDTSVKKPKKITF